MNIDFSDRIKNLPPYLFAQIDNLKKDLISKGRDVIDLGVGDPDLPTDDLITKQMCFSVKDQNNHKYPSYSGLAEFRMEASNYLKKRFNIEFDYKKEIITLIGSKEGIFHFPFAFLNKGDYVLCPDPGYPVYEAGTSFAGGLVYKMPLLEKNSFFPDLGKIPDDIKKNAKIIWINYPNNPTSSEATISFFEEVISFCKKYNIIACHDSSYSEVYFGSRKPLSIFNVNKAKDIAIEFHSLSKTFNMTGWRLGFACGNEKLIFGLGKVKTNVDSGQFQAVQWAGIEALRNYESLSEKNNRIYLERRRIVEEALSKIGLPYINSETTFYVWAKVPDGFTSSLFSQKVLENLAVVITPGTGFGNYGEGYFRISLTSNTQRIKEAMVRLSSFVIKEKK